MPTPDPLPTGACPDDARFHIDARFRPGAAMANTPMANPPMPDDARFDALPGDADRDADLDAHLASLLAAVPRCPAPPGFTARVMAALPPVPQAGRASGTPGGTPPSRPAAAPVRGPQPRWRIRWGSVATFGLVVLVVGASLVGLPRQTQTAGEAPVSAAEVAHAREQVELALSLLGSAHHKAETDAARMIAR